MLLTNRIVRTPLTRATAAMPTSVVAQMHAQQAATAGLVVTPCIDVRRHCDLDEHLVAWRRVAEAVHAQGGKIVLQLSHAATSSQDVTQAYVSIATRFVDDACVDGIEVYAANGCLIDGRRESLQPRNPETPKHPLHELQHVVAAVADAIGGDRLGLRFSPLSNYSSESSDPDTLCQDVAKVAQEAKVAYVHLVHGDVFASDEFVAIFRATFRNTLVGDMGYTTDEANEAIRRRLVDAVAFDSNTTFGARSDLYGAVAISTDDGFRQGMN
ncbi:Aste57867_16723 [Aphanomyces stellatus]|uniref:Aste57867_16723 protein n=1 Tax=Aphanomyces stellatus TaxID=120398 RepID=A0A485L7B2_9STRA|nr:hypothetical protein As57867_016666 [Aphanomyces stellatus]VFT93493.1 Aste57867_16723 [Aphanomyces stellatus]